VRLGVAGHRSEQPLALAQQQVSGLPAAALAHAAAGFQRVQECVLHERKLRAAQRVPVRRLHGIHARHERNAACHGA
jgi:hypothetical protein